MLFENILNDYFLLPCISDVISTVSSSVIFSAVFSTFLIATDRFYAVTSPLHYSMTITRSRSQVMIVLAWLSGVALALPYILLCTISHHSNLQRSLHVIFTVMQTTIGYFFPFVGLCWLYLRMYHAAHRNSERTRKHSISGELLTVMDGSTSVIPQGIDFLTHYMNPFTRAPMAGSVQPVGNPHQDRNSIGQIVPVVVKKTRRRSSNGSSSSLLFREEGRAIKTAFFVLASFFVCWTPHFVLMLINEISDSPTNMHEYIVYDNITVMEMESSPLSAEMLVSGKEMDAEMSAAAQHQQFNNHPNNNNSFASSTTTAYGSDWAKFLGVFGMLLSSVLNPFIYVFRNKIACEEISRLLYGLFGFKLLSKEEHFNNHHPSLHKDKERKASDNGSGGGGGTTHSVMSSQPNQYDNDGLPSDVVDYQPRYSPCIGKSPKRSSMKSLTPQSSINSTMTNCNSLNGGGPPTDSPSGGSAQAHSDAAHYHNHHHHISFSNGRPSKPPFLRSLTLPEQQTQPRVKFPPNLTRQKSYASYRPPPTHGSGPSSTEITPAISKRAKFVRQDSVCSILSNDSVLMICSEDGMEVGPLGILNLGLSSQPPILANGVCTRSAAVGSTITRVPEDDSEEENFPIKICSNSIQGTPVTKCYLRQDSNFSDASHRTNDSGVVLSSVSSYSARQSDTCNNSSGSGSSSFTPERCRNTNLRQFSPSCSPSSQRAQSDHRQQAQHQNHFCKSRENCTIVHQGNHHSGPSHTHSQHQHSGRKYCSSSTTNTIAVVNNNQQHHQEDCTQSDSSSRLIVSSSPSSRSPRSSPILLQTSI